ncbi:D-cysteine desulfhydrase family protein [Candidatus Aerophobetes bacterium]|nr:D-cysteine desulfhydrase family protein [Candidatus Aerophobetes bacterium]
MFKYEKEKTQRLKERIGKLPRVHLANLPTPLEAASRLSEALKGPEIYFKRDDLTGLAFGGNKTRMFEFILAHALNMGADSVVAGAAAQSNYCRQMAAACSKLGLKAYLVLRKVRGDIDFQPQGNLLLDLLLGANVEIIEAKSPAEQTHIMQEVAEGLKAKGHRPYLARMANIEDVGLDAIAYVNCLLELYEQLIDMNLKPTYLYVAAADTTQAGLVLGAKYLGLDFPIIGINPLDKIWAEDVPPAVAKIANMAAEILGLDVRVEPSEVISYGEYVGEGYGKVTKEGVEAIKLVAEKEGLFLDPVYTGKAMSGLIDHIRKGKIKRGEKVIFLHTGGFPALFAYSTEFKLEDKVKVRE